MRRTMAQFVYQVSLTHLLGRLAGSSGLTLARRAPEEILRNAASLLYEAPEVLWALVFQKTEEGWNPLFSLPPRSGLPPLQVQIPDKAVAIWGKRDLPQELHSLRDWPGRAVLLAHVPYSGGEAYFLVLGLREESPSLEFRSLLERTLQDTRFLLEVQYWSARETSLREAVSRIRHYASALEAFLEAATEDGLRLQEGLAAFVEHSPESVCLVLHLESGCLVPRAGVPESLLGADFGEPEKNGIPTPLRRPLVWSNLAHAPGPLAAQLRALGARRMAAFPLEGQGVLVCAREGEPYDEDTLAILQMFARMVVLAERCQRAMQRLEEAETRLQSGESRLTVSEAAGGIAHSIGNALVPLMIYSDLLLSSGNLTKQERKYLENIREGTQKIQEYVGRLRELSAGTREEEIFLPFSVNAAVQEALNLLEPLLQKRAQSRNVVYRVEQQLDPRRPMIVGAQGAFREALFHVLVNALEAMPEGGAIRVRTSQNDEQVLVEVEDEGVGMEEEVLQRAREALFSTKPGASGMGLTIANRIAERMGGQLEIESQPGRGTRVRFRFPAYRPAPEAPRAARRVWVLDDNPHVLESVRQLLEEYGHHVETLRSLQAFREQISRATEKPEVVLVDYSLEDAHGVEALREVRKLAPEARRILMTAWRSAPDSRELAELADGVILKPVHAKDLLRLLGGPSHAGT